MRTRRYLLSSFARYFAVAGAGILLIFFATELLADLPDLIREHRRFEPAAYATALPRMFVRISPVVTFLAALLLLTEMLKHRETRVLEISGIPPRVLSTTLLAAGAVVSLLVFTCNELAVPPLEPRPAAVLEDVQFAAPGLRLTAPRLDIAAGVLERPFMTRELPDGGRVVSQGRRAEFAGAGWRLVGGRERRFSEDGTLLSGTADAGGELDLPLSPAVLRDSLRTPAAMAQLSSRDLRRLLAALAPLGLFPLPARAALQEKYAYPLLNLFILLPVLPFFFTRRRGSPLVAIALASLVMFASYVVYSCGAALAGTGRFPLWPASWLFHILASTLVVAGSLHARWKSRIMVPSVRRSPGTRVP